MINPRHLQNKGLIAVAVEYAQTLALAAEKPNDPVPKGHLTEILLSGNAEGLSEFELLELANAA